MIYYLPKKFYEGEQALLEAVTILNERILRLHALSKQPDQKRDFTKLKNQVELAFIAHLSDEPYPRRSDEKSYLNSNLYAQAQTRATYTGLILRIDYPNVEQFKKDFEAYTLRPLVIVTEQETETETLNIACVITTQDKELQSTYGAGQRPQ